MSKVIAGLLELGVLAALGTLLARGLYEVVLLSWGLFGLA